MDATLGLVVEQGSELRRRPITRLEYERMAEIGIFDPGERIELLRGEIVTMSPIGRPRVWSVARINRLLVERLGAAYDVQPQCPLTLWDDSEPEPDLAVVPAGTPTRLPDTCLLAVEVAQSSLRLDLTLKAAIYAEAGIPTYWVVDVVGRVVHVFTEPADGVYRHRALARPGEVLTAVALPDLAIEVAAIVPPAEPAADTGARATRRA